VRAAFDRSTMSQTSPIPTLTYGRPRRRRWWIVWTLLAIFIGTPLVIFRQPLSEWAQARWQRWQYTRAFDSAHDLIPDGQWFVDTADPAMQKKALDLLTTLDPGSPWPAYNAQIVGIAYDADFNGKTLCFMLVDHYRLSSLTVARDGQFSPLHARGYDIQLDHVDSRGANVKPVKTVATRFPTVLESAVLFDGTENIIQWQAQGRGPTLPLLFHMGANPRTGTFTTTAWRPVTNSNLEP
jgi:hypothetical protein